jgi:leucyl/phenylalanyl-tRNA--protein transferase
VSVLPNTSSPFRRVHELAMSGADNGLLAYFGHSWRLGAIRFGAARMATKVEPPCETGSSHAVLRRRAALFRETPFETFERVALGTLWALKPKRLGDLPPFIRLWLKDLVAPNRALPNPQSTFGKTGIAGIVHDLSAPMLIEAYRRGLFPSGHFGTLHWSSPPERCVLYFHEFHIAKRLRRLMRQERYSVTFDRDFEGVIKACAARREGRWHLTWITPRIMRAYADLFDAGHAHTFEVWSREGALVGGGYGVATGGVFSTESQFSLEDNTSKLGFSVLNWHLARWGFTLNDGNNPTPTILDMGFRMIPRAEFLRHLSDAETAGKPGRWEVETDPKTAADWQPAGPAHAVASLQPDLHGPADSPIETT